MLTWVPAPEDVERLGSLPAGVEVEPFPCEPLASPRLTDVEVLVPPYEPPDHRRLLQALPGMSGLRLVQTLTGGVDWLRPALPEHVTCCRSAGVFDEPVAEWVVGAVLGMQRGLFRCRDLQREGRWGTVLGRELTGQRVVLLGYGRIARAVERRLRPFGVEAVPVARCPRPGVHGVAEVDRLSSTADVVVALLPLTRETRGLVGAAFLAAMPDDGLLVNASRGPIVDTAALVAELRSGRLRAALDVTDPEPLPAHHPLWRLSGVFISPHIAGAPTPPMPPAAYELARTQLLRYLAGEPLAHRVEGEY